MPDISSKAKQIPASAIRKLTPYADAAKAAGVKVYHLNIGSPDIKSPVSAIDAVHNFEFDYLPYSNSAGDVNFRRALVQKYYSKLGIDVNEEEILVSVAGSEGVDLVLQVVCDPGDDVIVIEPYYTNYYSFAFRNGINLLGVHSDIREGFSVPPIEEFEKLVTPKTKAVILCNPGNPTGTLYTAQEIRRIGEFCRKHDLFIISDEAYREFCYSDEPYCSVMTLPGMEQHTILIDSVSKRYNLCGARIGCIVSHNASVLEAITKYAQARLCPPVLGQVAAMGALDATAEYFAAVRGEYMARRDFVIDALNKIDGVYSPMPMGAFYTLAELPVDDADDFARWMLSDFRLDNETVMVTPAASFYCDHGKCRNQVRIAYVLEVSELKKAMRILEEGLKAYRAIKG